MTGQTRKLPQRRFNWLRRVAPLISIDLIIQDSDGRILLGLRKNPPAEHTWFVPGGRIEKDERLGSAFRRITQAEIGDVLASVKFEDAQRLGAFDHIYPEEESGLPGSTVHYVALGYRVQTDRIRIACLPDTQHSEWRWATASDIRNDESVHRNTKQYFAAWPIHTDQYPIIAERHVSHDNLLWQSPVVSLTAQAFLFTLAFDEDKSFLTRAPAAALVVLVAIASIHLMQKHRAYELHAATLLAEYERATPNHRVVHDRLFLKGWRNYPAHRMWHWLLVAFMFAGIWGCVWAILNAMCIGVNKPA